MFSTFCCLVFGYRKDVIFNFFGWHIAWVADITKIVLFLVQHSIPESQKKNLGIRCDKIWNKNKVFG